jgi:hypothetical protein
MKVALECQDQIPRGREEFANCWIWNFSTQRQQDIIDCWQNRITTAGFAVCASNQDLGADAYQIANCLERNDPRTSGTELATCLVKGKLPPEQLGLLDCVASNQNNTTSMGLCIGGQQLSADERRILNCVANNRASYINMGICAAGTQLSPEQRRIAGCVMSNRGSYVQMGVCIAGPYLTPEQQVFMTCAIQTGMQPYAFAGCVGAELTANELQKCVDQGIGGSGCFGDNNFFVKYYRERWKDITQGPGRSNDLFGADGVVGRTLEDIRKNSPPPVQIGTINGRRICLPWC